MINGANWIVKLLKNCGVTTVFGYPGGQIMPLYDALYDGGVEHVLCRHEQGAVMAAIGYARSKNEVGVCIATSGPGATNLITGLADALMDSVPVVAIVGQVSTGLIGTDAFQETDVLGMSLSCTKHSFLVDDPANLPDILALAFHVAKSGRPGPVLIDLPKDIQLAAFDFDSSISKSRYYQQLIALNAPTYNAPLSDKIKAQITEAKTFISAAKKPVLYIGVSILSADASNELREFVKNTKIPSVTTLKGIGALDVNDPYYLGMIGMHGTKEANLAVQECDLLLAIGVRFDDRVTSNLNQFASNATIIHIDIDASELNKLKQANLPICLDAKTAIPLINTSVTITPWQKHVLALKSQHQINYQSPSNNIYAPALLKQLSKQIENDKTKTTFVTTDVGQHQMWSAQHMQFNQPNTFISSCGLGTMGFGLPAALGVQIANPTDAVICITGDGSFMMNIQELATIKRKSLPIKVLLLDNERLGMVRQWQQLFFKSRYSETDLSDNPDFLQLASAFNIKGISISRKDQITPALNQMLTHDGAFLLHVKINELENVWPLVPPGAANHDMLDDVKS